LDDKNGVTIEKCLCLSCRQKDKTISELKDKLEIIDTWRKRLHRLYYGPDVPDELENHAIKQEKPHLKLAHSS
jgi:hypothetical protein